MAAPDVNTVGLMISKETGVPGTLPGSPEAYFLEPNTIGKWGAEVSTTTRQPISRDRLPRSSVVIDLDSGCEAEFDLTSEHLRIFIDSIMMSTGVGRTHRVFKPTAVNLDEYVVADDNVTVPVGTLIFAKGFALSANNGLKVVAGVPSDTEIPADNIAVEAVSADQNATVEICGVQGASGDITLTAGVLGSTILDFTTLGWVVGQHIHLGDPHSGAAYRFAGITDDQYQNGDGFARIRAITAHEVTLDKHEVIAALTDAGAGKTIRILYGEFHREWPDDHANHDKVYSTVEMSLPDLFGLGTDGYSYAKGNLADSATLAFPLNEKATIGMKWVGTDTPVPTDTRVVWAAKKEAVLTDPFNTTTSYRRLRLMELGGDAVINELKDLSITISNNVAAEKTQRRLGAFKMNLGSRSIECDSTWLLDDPGAWIAIRGSTRVTMDLAMGGDHGGFYIDITACKLSGGDPGLDLNTTVTTKVMIKAEKDLELGYAMGVSRFPYLPAYNQI